MPAPDTETQKKISPVESFIFGALVTALLTIPICLKAGRCWEREEFKRVGTSMDQAQRRHREYLERADKRLEFVHQCVDELDHVDAPSAVLDFCSKETPRSW